MTKFSKSKRYFLFVFSFLFSMLSLNGHAMEWAGLYHGKVSGQPSQLTLNRAGTDIIGVLDAKGHRYKVEGNLQQDKLIGFCRDTKTGKTGQLSAVTIKGAVIIKVVLPGFHRPARLVFERAEKASSIFTQLAMR